MHLHSNFFSFVCNSAMDLSERGSSNGDRIEFFEELLHWGTKILMNHSLNHTKGLKGCCILQHGESRNILLRKKVIEGS